MNLHELLEQKLGQVGVQKFGEETSQKLKTIELEKDAAEALTLGLISLQEAENHPTLIAKVKDAQHTIAKKGVLDSIDSILPPHLAALKDRKFESTKERVSEIMKAYLEDKQTLESEVAALNLKLKAGVGDADSRAIIGEKEAELEKLRLAMASDYVSKETVAETSKKVVTLETKLKEFETSLINSQITSIAQGSKSLGDSFKNSPLLDEVIKGAIKKYLKEERFGIGSDQQGVLVLDEDKKLTLRNKADENMSIMLDSKVLSISDLVEKAVVKYGLGGSGFGGVAPTNPYEVMVAQKPTNQSDKLKSERETGLYE